MTDTRTRDELRAAARVLGITGYSAMNKAALLSAVQGAEAVLNVHPVPPQGPTCVHRAIPADAAYDRYVEQNIRNGRTRFTIAQMRSIRRHAKRTQRFEVA